MKYPQLTGLTALMILSGVQMNAQKKKNVAPATQSAIERSNNTDVQKSSGEENSTTQ